MDRETVNLITALVSAVAILAASAVTLAADRRLVKLEHVPFMRLTDDQVLSCACPGCKRWDKEWRHGAAPELRNQTVRECVIDMTLAIEGEP